MQLFFQIETQNPKEKRQNILKNVSHVYLKIKWHFSTQLLWKKKSSKIHLAKGLFNQFSSALLGRFSIECLRSKGKVITLGIIGKENNFKNQ